MVLSPGMIDALDRMIDDILSSRNATIEHRTDGMIDALPIIWTE